jgi:rare lipoprotein A
MKTSAGIFFSRGLFLRCLLPFLAIALVASCSARTKHVRAKPVRAKRMGHAVASWYGPKFHGRLTASGERYDMDAMTCAHKKLPFGSRLKLKSVENGKTVVVVVNDRGPFVRGRDIDLSRAAAKKLGIIGPGTGKVKVYYLGRDMRYKKYIAGGVLPKSSSAGKKSGIYTIQVAAFSERDNAEYLRKGLKLNHKKVYVMEKWVNGERFYRVRIGKFSTEDKARSYSEILSEEGYEANVIPFERRL